MSKTAANKGLAKVAVQWFPSTQSVLQGTLRQVL